MEEFGIQERSDALEEGGDFEDSSCCEAYVVLCTLGDGDAHGDQFDVFKVTADIGGYLTFMAIYTVINIGLNIIHEQ